MTLFKCRRHDWLAFRDEVVLEDSVTIQTGHRCSRCGTVRDEVLSRRARNNRKRGNSIQAKVAKAAGIANIGALGLPVDAGWSTEWLRIQAKSGKGYPKTLDRWLRAIPVRADQLRGVVYVETPGPGRRAKRLIVLDYDEFLAWYGPTSKEPAA